MTDKAVRYLYAGVLAAGLLTLLIIVVVHPLNLNHDVTMYLEIGNFLLDGRQPYVDYYEINPPLIHYVSIIPAFLARLTGLNPITVMLWLVTGLNFWSTLTVRRLLQRHLPQPDPLSVYLPPIIMTLSYLYTTLLNNNGQREHLFILFFLPFFIVRWLRWQGLAAQVPRSTTLVLGVLAGVGACLKPYFLLAVALPELYWLLTRRRFSPFWQPEIFGMGAAGLIYGAHFMLLPPASRAGLFEFILPTLLDGYAAYGHQTIGEFFTIYTVFGLAVLALPLISAVLPLRRWQGTLWHFTQPVAMFGVAAFGAFVVQGKGWPYHRLPFDLAVLMVTLLLIFTTRRQDPGQAEPDYSAKRVRRAVTPLFAGMLIFTLVTFFAPRMDVTDPQLQQIVLAHTAENDGILIVDSSVNPTYPTVMKSNRHTIGSFTVDFPLPIGFYGVTDEALFYDPTVEPPALIQTYLDTLQRDVAQYAPALIVIRQGECQFCPETFDPVRFFEERGFVVNVIDPDYRRLQDLPSDRFAVWVRQDAP